MASGVRNLRAMFEQQNKESSPPDRGRSPGESAAGGSSTGTSPRPLSKVRTAFVTVEGKNGQLGLQLPGVKSRDTSGEPSMAKRRTSFSIDEEDNPKTTAERKQSIASEMEARKNSSAISETIPEQAIETPSLELNKQLGGPSGNRTEALKTAAKAEPKKMVSTSNGLANGTSKPTTKTTEKTTTKDVSKPNPISTAGTTSSAKSSPKKIRTPKTPTTPSSRGRTLKTAPAKTPDQRPEKKAARPPTASSNGHKPASRPPTQQAHGSAPKTRIPESPPQTGFVKPRPKSPTRPIKLPASLTAHTASSGSKTAGAAPLPSRTLSRASGNVQHTNPLQSQNAAARSPSRASTKHTLQRKPSTLKPESARPSLGPPPSTLNRKPSRQSLPSSAPADEGFLARMMRPTASSSSKTAEKAATPPKRSQSVRRPVTRDGPPKFMQPHEGAVQKPYKEATVAKNLAKPTTKQQNGHVKAKAEPTSGMEASSVAKEDKPEVKETPDETSQAVETKPELEKIPVEVSEAVERSIPVVENTSIEPDNVKADDPIVAKEAPVADVVEAQTAEPTPVKEASAPVEEKPISEEATPASVEDLPSALENPVLASSSKEETPEAKKSSVAVEPEVAKEVFVEADSVKEETVAEEAMLDGRPLAEEDPEDAKAREEIAKLNAEFLMAGNEAK